MLVWPFKGNVQLNVKLHWIDDRKFRKKSKMFAIATVTQTKWHKQNDTNRMTQTEWHKQEIDSLTSFHVNVMC